MHKWHQVQKFAHHWLHEINEHSLHEPFAYDIYTSVVVPSRTQNPDEQIERIRETYLSEKKTVHLNSPGANSTFTKRSLYQTAFHGSTKPRHAQMLTLLATYYGSKMLLELGTSLGLTSLYLSSVPGSNLVTIEGDPMLCTEAKKNLGNSGNVRVISGNIDDTLDQVLADMNTVDFAYFDANHRYRPTIDYFEKTLQYCHEQSVLVFDDIHWSAEMSNAWHDISKHPRVSVTMDFYHMGWVFLKPMERKYDYILSLN